MGSQDPDFADDLIEELRDRIFQSRQVAFKFIYWADVFEGTPAEYLRCANTRNELDYPSLRRFMVGALVYASAYRRVDDDPQSTYARIHTVV